MHTLGPRLPSDEILARFNWNLCSVIQLFFSLFFSLLSVGCKGGLAAVHFVIHVFGVDHFVQERGHFAVFKISFFKRCCRVRLKFSFQCTHLLWWRWPIFLFNISFIAFSLCSWIWGLAPRNVLGIVNKWQGFCGFFLLLQYFLRRESGCVNWGFGGNIIYYKCTHPTTVFSIQFIYLQPSLVLA